MLHCLPVCLSSICVLYKKQKVRISTGTISSFFPFLSFLTHFASIIENGAFCASFCGVASVKGSTSTSHELCSEKKVQLSSSRYLHICLACQVISGAGAVCPSYLHSVSYLQGDLFVYTASTILVNKIVPFSINQNELLFSFWIFT